VSATVGAGVRPVSTLDGRLAPTLGRGRFEVERPGSWLRRRAAGLLGLPRAGHDVAVQLRVRADDRRAVDRWERTFDGRRMVTSQRYEPAAIVERLGPVEVRLAIVGDGLASTAVDVALGPVRLRVPAALAPQVRCRVVPAGGGDRLVAVEVATAGGRTLCRYGGRLHDAGAGRVGARGAGGAS
jgi:hypothetical protein